MSSTYDPMISDIDRATLDAVACSNPHHFYGAHEEEAAGGTVFRTRQPAADLVSVRIGGVDYPLECRGSEIWAGIVEMTDIADYRLVIHYPDGCTRIVADPYRFLPTVHELDEYLIGEGRHEELWKSLGAHTRTYTTPDGEVTGVSFAVWAPNARGVSVCGDFNGWNTQQYPLRTLGSSGVWEIFIPEIGEGALYKFAIHGADGVIREKFDPFAFATEVPPATASRVFESHYEWQDDEWMDARPARQPHLEPMSVYELHLGSWKSGQSYRELADSLIDYLDYTNFTHVELLPVAEHPFGGSWGYQVSAYYAPTARFGSPDDFRYLVDRLHQAGYGVLVDWVPAHFPKDAWALSRFDGTPLYEHPDPRRGEQPDWGTYVFNFGRREVRNFLVANALFWLQEYHVDGLRVDAVASMLYLDYSRSDGEWLPNQYGGRENLEAVQFLQEMNATVHKHFPGVVTVAEESTSWQGVTRDTASGGLGFSFKWNMGWMNDTLRYFGRDQLFRNYHHQDITFSLMYAWSENFVLPISHDEVVHGKGSLWERMPGDAWAKAAGLRAFLAYMWAHPGKNLLFMGQEFGQSREWSDERGLDWGDLDGWQSEFHRGILSCTRDLNLVYRENRALWSQDHHPGGFNWIDANDSNNNVITFLRFGDDGSIMACLFNFSGIQHDHYRVGLPAAGFWHEVLNTDSTFYYGSGGGNLGGVTTEDVSWHDRPYSAEVTLPPNTGIWLRYEG